MSVFIVGGDRLGNISDNLKKLGFAQIIHEKGRKKIKKSKNIYIPGEAGLVIILTDFVNHNIAETIKKEAKSRAVPVVYAKRSWSAIAPKLKQCCVRTAGAV